MYRKCYTHSTSDDECHFRQKVSAGTLRLLVKSAYREFWRPFPCLSGRWTVEHSWREGDRWQTDREKPRRVCPSSWTGSCLPRRTAANVWQATKNRPTCTDCILIDPNMRGRAHRDSQARRHYVRSLAPSRDLFLWNLKLAEGVQDSFDDDSISTESSLENVREKMERFSRDVLDLSSSRQQPLVVCHANENITREYYASASRDPRIDLTNCGECLFRGVLRAVG